LIIAIDGTAGSGKSTTARLVARKLNFLHIDTGAMYRAAAYAVLKNNIDPDDKSTVEELVEGLKIRLQQNDEIQVLLNDKPVTDKIRSPEVTAIVSTVSSYDGVRRKLVKEQREMGKARDVVLEGRDIGTVVFPEADVKLFFIADIEERVRRRCHDMIEQGEKVDFDTLLTDIKSRDRLDSTRKASPLKKAEDAITIDTSNLTIDEQVEKVLSLISKKQSDKPSVKE